MKRIAILVIASTSRPLYVHYIKTYWSALIHHTRVHRPHIDVFLLFEHGTDLHEFGDLAPNIIQDPNPDLATLCDPAFHNMITPGVLSKTIHALELLRDRYDVYFRTNLSSMIRVPHFDQFVQDRPRIGYSGSGVWQDALREDLVHHGKVGPDQSIKSLAELDDYPGNTFVSGSGYFLNAAEVSSLVERKDQIRYDIVDDVSIGLMLTEHENLPDFSLTVAAEEPMASIKHKIRASGASHVRWEHFPLKKAQEIWKHIAHGQLWKAPSTDARPDSAYKIYFPLFDHIESESNEIRLTHEGLTAHPRVSRVRDPESADYLMLCQNHIVDHCPFHSVFRPIKDAYKHKTIMLDYDDVPEFVYDRDDFRWALYFKRSCVDRQANRAMDYGGLPIEPTAYCVVDDMAEPPGDYDGRRSIAVSCLFEDSILDSPVFERVRGRLLTFARELNAKSDLPMQIGPVSEVGPVGRSWIDERYKRTLFDSKIVLHANPDLWEGDARTWEAVCSGALVFIDRMCQPIRDPLMDGEHVVFYDVTDEGLRTLEEKILYYLAHDEEREKIGRQGREFVLSRHRSIHRVDAVIEALDAQAADRAELKVLADMNRAEGLERFVPAASRWVKPRISILPPGKDQPV